MLKKFFQAIAPGPKLIHVPVDCPPLQHYPGYLPEDRDLLLRYADAKAEVGESAYVDGFGVKTEFACVPFVAPSALNSERLQLPLPDDGFHAEGIEYVALLDSFYRRKVRGRFTAVEIGSGWGPWIGLAGVLASRHGVNDLHLVGAEASPERYALMCRHLRGNGLVSGAAKTVTTFNGAVWTHDGEVQFPDSDVRDMGPAVTAAELRTDYRGQSVRLQATPCKKLSTLCQSLSTIDFLHVDIQGSEYQLISAEVDWITENVQSMMIATHSRVIEGLMMDLLGKSGWTLCREKPCRFNLEGGAATWEGRTSADGSQYWVNSGL